MEGMGVSLSDATRKRLGENYVAFLDGPPYAGVASTIVFWSFETEGWNMLFDNYRGFTRALALEGRSGRTSVAAGSGDAVLARRLVFTHREQTGAVCFVSLN